jgi:hypothetical protein
MPSLTPARRQRREDEERAVQAVEQVVQRIRAQLMHLRNLARICQRPTSSEEWTYLALVGASEWKD